MRFAFAGDRQIAVNILKFLLSKGHKPMALIVVDGPDSTHSDELMNVAQLDQNLVFMGSEFTSVKSVEILKSLDLDYIIGIHFPYIVPNNVLSIPKVGFLNLHPSYLPYNKGWHTPSWAIIDGTPYGATIHFMSEKLDEGDILHQKLLDILPEDTADSLYMKVNKLEEEVFKEALAEIITLSPKRSKQTLEGSSHAKNDLKKIQEIGLDQNTTYGEVITTLKALTTNNKNEASYFVKDGKQYFVQIIIGDRE
jgi:methionyl-tRNA formyltransferase